MKNSFFPLLISFISFDITERRNLKQNILCLTTNGKVILNHNIHNTGALTMETP